MTPEEAARALQRAAARLPQLMKKAELQNLGDAFSTARLYSSGMISSAELAAMGHPYATRDPRPPQDPAIINIQSRGARGQPTGLLASWEMDGPHVKGDTISGEVHNTSPHAVLLELGTSRMIARPLVEAVEEEIADRVQARREKAIEEAFR